MRILFISHDASRSGAPIALLQELHFIKEHCSDIIPEVLLLGNGELKYEFSKICKIYKGWNKIVDLFNLTLHKINVKFKYNFFVHIIKKDKYDCLYANTIVSLYAGCLLKKKLGIPLILHVHEAECLMHAYEITQENLSLVDAFVTVSKFAADNLISNYNISKDKIEIQYPISIWSEKILNNEIGNGISLAKNDIVLIGCFVNCKWYKSIDILPILLKKFYSKYPNCLCKFVLIGFVEEEVRWRINYEMSKTDTSDKVIWLENQKNPLTYLSQLDILLLISREESFSLVAQEAALMRTPIVGFSHTTGIEELLKNEGGFWSPYLDIDAIVDNIHSLCVDKGLRKQMGDNAYDIMYKAYNYSRMMVPIVNLLNKISRK